MIQLRRRFLSFLMSLAMVISLVQGLPVMSVVAEEGEQETEISQTDEFIDPDNFSGLQTVVEVGLEYSETDEAMPAIRSVPSGLDSFYEKNDSVQNTLKERMSANELAFYNSLENSAISLAKGGDLATTNVGDRTVAYGPWISYGSLSAENAKNIWLLFVWQNPQYFFIDRGTYLYSLSSNDIRLAVYSDFAHYSDRDAALIKAKAGWNKYLEVLGDCIDTCSCDFDKEHAIHDTVALELEYDHSNKNKFSQSVYSALVPLNDNDTYCTTVCAGYASLFNMLANHYGLDTVTVLYSGTGNNDGHAWNKIYINEPVAYNYSTESGYPYCADCHEKMDGFGDCKWCRCGDAYTRTFNTWTITDYEETWFVVDSTAGDQSTYITYGNYNMSDSQASSWGCAADSWQTTYLPSATGYGNNKTGLVLDQDGLNNIVAGPSCFHRKVEKYTCSRCGNYYSVPRGNDLADHVCTYGPTSQTGATCTEPATKTYSCDYCGEVYTVKTSDALGHVPYTTEVAPTCTSTGSRITRCSRCGATLSSTTLAMTAHEKVYRTKSAATCTQAEVREQYCKNCGIVFGTSSGQSALGHSWGNWVIVTPATDTTDGLQRRTCSRCGATDDEVIPADNGDAPPEHIHTEDNGTVTTPATCQQTGLMTYTCTDCGEVTRTEVIPVKSHTLVTDAAVAATCTKDGKTEGKHCSVCGTVTVAQTTVSALGHDMGEWITMTEPTTIQKGYRYRNCKRQGCEYTESEVLDLIPAQPMTVDELYQRGIEFIDNNDLEGVDYYEWLGDIRYYVASQNPSNASAILSAVDACEHSTLNQNNRAHECNTLLGKLIAARNDSNTYSKFDTSSDTYNGVVSLITSGNAILNGNGADKSTWLRQADNYVNDHIDYLKTRVHYEYTASAGLSDNVKTEYVQTVVGYLISWKNLAASTAHIHIEDDGTVTKEPTCTEKGVKTYKCTICQEVVRTEEISSLGHNYVVTPAVPATCTHTGLTEGNQCSRCGDIRFPQQEINIDPDAHDWGEWTVITPATATTDGLERRVCKNSSSHVEERIIPKTGPSHTHTSDGGVITKQPTCTETGVKTYTCTGCGEVLRTQTLDKIDHNWGTGTITTPASCETDGERTYTCSMCHTTKKVTIHAFGHQETSYVDVAATCSEGGRTGGTYCARCYKVITEPTRTSALGHDWSNWTVKTPATATADGIEERHCSRCEAVETRTIPASGSSTHTHKEDSGTVAKPATCSETGIRTYKCTECGETIRTEVIDKVAHTEVPDDYIAPTCTSFGRTAGSHCSVCGKVINATSVIPKTDHIWDDGKVTKEATTTETGTKVFTCLHCNATKTEIIPKISGGDSGDQGGDTPPVNPDEPGGGDTPDVPDNPDNPDNPTDKIIDISGKTVVLSNIPAVKDLNDDTVKDVRVSVDGKDLEYGKDYTASVKTDPEKGIITITVTGKGDYSGTFTKVINLAAGSIRKAYVSNVSDVIYTGEEIKPVPVLKINGVALVEGTDYTVSYRSNTNAGVATVVIQGVDGYFGTIYEQFIINPKQALVDIKLSSSTFKYNGESQYPTAKVYRDGEEISEDEYELTIPSDSVNPGIYTVRADLVGNYRGVKVASYNIASKSLAISSISGDSKAVTVNWDNSDSEYTGCQIQYSTTADFSKDCKVRTTFKSSPYTINNLDSKKTYYVRIRLCKLVGVKYTTGDWSDAKSVTTK